MLRFHTDYNTSVLSSVFVCVCVGGEGGGLHATMYVNSVFDDCFPTRAPLPYPQQDLR